MMWLCLLLVLLAALVAARLIVGTSGLGWPQGLPEGALLRLRALRAWAAVAVGVALAVSGVGLQALLRNPLAEPFILGLSSGAAAGIMAQKVIEYRWHRMLSQGMWGALAGAAVSAAIVYLASRRRGLLDPLGLLLTGVVLSMINGAVIMLLNYLPVGPAGLQDEIGKWMMGYLQDYIPLGTLLVTSGLILAGLALFWWCGRAMDVATFADMEAQSLGVNLKLLRTILFVGSGVLAAVAVVLAGPIAFVGLICPHIARLLFGPGHRILVIGAALLGATLVLLADTTAAYLDYRLGIGILPIGIFTALVGGPVFLWMLRPQLGKGSE